MLSTSVTTLVLTAAVAAAVMGGAFFAFSTFVMQALGALPPSEGAAVMQEINRKATTPLFMLGLFGTAAACVAIGWNAASNWRGPVSVYLIGGVVVYLVGIFVMTAVFHVPRNNALDAVDPATADGAALWAMYLRDWTLGNHVRTAAGITSSALLLVATRIG